MSEQWDLDQDEEELLLYALEMLHDKEGISQDMKERTAKLIKRFDEAGVSLVEMPADTWPEHR